MRTFEARTRASGGNGASTMVICDDGRSSGNDNTTSSDARHCDASIEPSPLQASPLSKADNRGAAPSNAALCALSAARNSSFPTKPSTAKAGLRASPRLAASTTRSRARLLKFAGGGTCACLLARPANRDAANRSTRASPDDAAAASSACKHRATLERDNAADVFCRVMGSTTKGTDAIQTLPARCLVRASFEANNGAAASRQAPQAPPNDNGESRWALLLNGSAVVSSSSSGTTTCPKRFGWRRLNVSSAASSNNRSSSVRAWIGGASHADAASHCRGQS